MEQGRRRQEVTRARLLVVTGAALLMILLGLAASYWLIRVVLGVEPEIARPWIFAAGVACFAVFAVATFSNIRRYWPRVPRSAADEPDLPVVRVALFLLLAGGLALVAIAALMKHQVFVGVILGVAAAVAGWRGNAVIRHVKSNRP